MLDYRLVFEKHGELRPSSGLMKNEVWLDVGNALGMGYFDHHQVEGYKSAFSALVNNLHFLADLGESARRQEPIIVHLHEEPDFDCVASYYAVRYYLEHNASENQAFFGEDGKARILEKYINDIDAGRNKVTDYPTLYAIFSCLDMGREKSEETDHYVVDRGLELISAAMDLLASEEADLAEYDFSRLPGETFANEISHIDDTSYKNEKKRNAIVFEQISVWTKDGDVEKVPAAIWKQIPCNNNDYNNARNEGNVITIVPYSIKEGGSDTTRAFASINPDIDTDKKYSLRSIAEIIEQMEQIEEERLYEREGTYRRDHSRPREAAGHLGKMPFAATSDPWFLKPEEDLFDAPRIQSILRYDDILEVIRNNGSAVKKSYAVALHDEPALLYEKGKSPLDGKPVSSSVSCPALLYEKSVIPLSTWQEEIKGILNGISSHVVVWGELDASLIRRGNRLLEAYCMNLIGKPFHEQKGKSIYFADYRTCICSDIDSTVILTATYEGYDASQMVTAGMLDIGSGESFRKSPLIADIAAIVRQRSKLLEYGNEIGELKPKKRKEIENLNDRMLALSVQMQKDDMIEDAVERDIYSFIKTQFGISDLKSSVTDAMGIIVGESRDRFISKFNVLSAFAVPFVLLATIFQMGAVKFEELLNLSGVQAVIGWGAVVLLTVGLVFWLSNYGDGEGK